MSGEVFFTEIIFRATNYNRGEGDPLCDIGVEGQQLGIAHTVSSISGCLWFITFADIITLAGVFGSFACMRAVCMCWQGAVASLCPGPVVMIIPLCQ